MKNCIFLFILVISLSACERDACHKVTCKNNGVCNDGTCMNEVKYVIVNGKNKNSFYNDENGVKHGFTPTEEIWSYQMNVPSGQFLYLSSYGEKIQIFIGGQLYKETIISFYGTQKELSLTTP